MYVFFIKIIINLKKNFSHIIADEASVGANLTQKKMLKDGSDNIFEYIVNNLKIDNVWTLSDMDNRLSNNNM